MTLHQVMEEVGEKEKFTHFFPTFDVIFILLADYDKKKTSKKAHYGWNFKEPVWLRLISNFKRVCGPLLSSHTLLETPPIQLAPAFIHDLH